MISSHQLIGSQWLSYRQGQVLLCCAYGLTMKQTAEKLFISHKTVDGHRQKVRQLYNVEGYYGLHCLGLKLQDELEKWQGTKLRPNRSS